MIDKDQFLTIDDMVFGTQDRTPAQIAADTKRTVRIINEWKKKQKTSKATTRKKKKYKAVK
jgi:hypothetical protein